MKIKCNSIVIICLVSLIVLSWTTIEWGFFGHKRINFQAVLTIPPPLIGFFKPHIYFLSERAVQPDMRRYANAYEGYKHYIDLDTWMQDDSLTLSGNESYDRIMSGTWSVIIHGKQEKIQCLGIEDGRYLFTNETTSLSIDSVGLTLNLRQQLYEEEVEIKDFLLPTFEGKLIYNDELVKRGVLPYSFVREYYSLVNAFMGSDLDRILNICADIGHYIADAHVPLHTTSNYNGQETQQIGIHAFWESRIPELLADREFDELVGPALYIEDVDSFIWDVVLTSYSLVDRVLEAEHEVGQAIPEDEHFCYEERNNQTVRVQCTIYTEAYNQAMDKMVEKQWRKAIRNVGSVWYSAWVDAGQPDVGVMNHFVLTSNENLFQKLQELLSNSHIIGRSHD